MKVATPSASQMSSKGWRRGFGGAVGPGSNGVSGADAVGGDSETGGVGATEATTVEAGASISWQYWHLIAASLISLAQKGQSFINSTALLRRGVQTSCADVARIPPDDGATSLTIYGKMSYGKSTYRWTARPSGAGTPWPRPSSAARTPTSFKYFAERGRMSTAEQNQASVAA
jgi:hypothetical protein